MISKKIQSNRKHTLFQSQKASLQAQGTSSMYSTVFANSLDRNRTPVIALPNPTRLNRTRGWIPNMTNSRQIDRETDGRSTVGKRAFPVAGANMWNEFPLHVASAQSLVVVKQRLKTFIFSCSYPDILIRLTYLLLLSLFFFSDISCGPCNNWHFRPR